MKPILAIFPITPLPSGPFRVKHKDSDDFTSTMRYEHRIVGRWVAELGKDAKMNDPILARSVTLEQFKKEILGGKKL